MSEPSEPKSQDGARGEFQPVDDPAEALKLLREGAKTLAAAMIWTKDQKHVINSHLNLLSDEDKLLYAWVPKDLDPAKFMDDLARAGVSDCFFSVSLARANIFFRAKFMGFDSGGLQFRLPEKIFKVQRRKDMRFPIPDGISLKAEFTDPLFPDSKVTKKVLDLSAGGLAILVSDTEEAMYHPGLTLKELTFAIRGRKITVDGEVRHTRVLPLDSRTPGVKIGVIFKNIKPGDSQAIASYVFEESRKYFSRFL